MEQERHLRACSRRSFLHVSATASAALTLRVVTEPMLAWAGHQAIPKTAILINSNENPLGPGESARAAASAMIAQSGRYHWDLTDELVENFTGMNGLRPDYVHAFPGSSEPLHYTVMAFTSPTRSYVTADPGYEAGLYASKMSGARIVKVPLAKTYAHDVKAMLAAAPDAGVFYICTPNNPTGTLTSHSDIEYLLEKKPKDAIVLVDEAYIHFSDAQSAMDLVKADKDLIVLRTFSKLYGMAGLRCGFAIGRPDLLSKMHDRGGWNSMPVTAVVAAAASLKDPQIVPERKRINSEIREQTFHWLDHNGYSYIRSASNFFLLDTKRPGKDVIDAMTQQNVIIGRVWPVMPTWVRITVGTRPEMEQFQAAFKKVMDGTAVGRLHLPRKDSRRHLDGIVYPS
ncbi:MAG: pyridoxal phosphate-dependent aminotransferase [Terriglobales bacterium]